MNCLHCGDCCRRMSPISAPDPCPHIDERMIRGQEHPFVFCLIYQKRPPQCRNHGYSATYCPIGVDVLELVQPEQAHARIDAGWHATGGGDDP